MAANDGASSDTANHKVWLVPVCTALISMVGTVSIAYLNVLPQLRVVAPTPPDAKGGTSANAAADAMAPHIQWLTSATESSVSQEEFVRKGKRALDNSGFTGIEARDAFAFGFSGQYTAVVLRASPEMVIFTVSGPKWEVADQRLVKLKREF